MRKTTSKAAHVARTETGTSSSASVEAGIVQRSHDVGGTRIEDNGIEVSIGSGHPREGAGKVTRRVSTKTCVGTVYSKVVQSTSFGV